MIGAHLLAALVLTVGATAKQPLIKTDVSPSEVNTFDITIPSECRGNDVYIATTTEQAPVQLWAQSAGGNFALDKIETKAEGQPIYHFRNDTVETVKVFTVSESVIQAAIACWGNSTAHGPTKTNEQHPAIPWQPTLRANK
jgi:hypothetical protein